MLNKISTIGLVAAISAPAFASETPKVTPEQDNGTVIAVEYNVWFQDHESVGKRYVSAQNNIIKLTAYTQDKWIPNVSFEAGKAESNLFAYTESELRAFYQYHYNGNLTFDYGAGVSARYDARHGKLGEPTTLDWEAIDPQITVGVNYKIPQFDGLSVFTSLEKRFNEHNSGFSGGTTTQLGARYVFVAKGERTISAEIGYRRDIQDHVFSIEKTEEPPAGGGDGSGEATTQSANTYFENENRRMLSDGFYLGVRMTF
jgi:hypothetical protein